MTSTAKLTSFAAATCLLVSGCSSVGPKTIPADQFNYAEAIRDSWKQQMLLNMVGLRYAEAPMFLRVTSVINQYSIDGKVSLASPPYKEQAAALPPVGVAGGYSDRPTITYTPMTGAEFTKSVMTPIPPASLMSLIQAGWRADLLIRLAVRSINGVGSTQVVGTPHEQSAYYEMVLLFQKLQASGGLSFRVEERGPDEVAIIVIRTSPSEEVRLNRQRLAELLSLDPGLREYRLVFGHQASGGNEIAMLTRSILEMLVDLAMWVEVPPEHIDSGRTRPSPSAEILEDYGFSPLIRVHSSAERPDPNEAFVMVRYEDLWYWIEQSDFASKRTLSFMQLMFSLAESGAGQMAPVVTVQAGG
jgi:hypothetical protein